MRRSCHESGPRDNNLLTFRCRTGTAEMPLNPPPPRPNLALMPHFLRRLLPLFALVALACVPAGGLPRGFLCDCSGVLRASSAADCDHGPECQRPAEPQHGEPGHEDEDHDHDEEVAPLLGALEAGPAVLPHPSWFICWLPWQQGHGQRPSLVLTGVGMEIRPPPDPHGAGLAWATILPHTIALRI
jgi:hypothetical protein